MLGRHKRNIYLTDRRKSCFLSRLCLLSFFCCIFHFQQSLAFSVDTSGIDSINLINSSKSLGGIIESGSKKESRQDYFTRFEGKIIRRIRVSTQLSKFSVSNSKPEYVQWSARAGLKAAEALHADTKRKRIYDFLLIHEGEEIKSQKMVEAERLLRSNRFMDDAIFIIREETMSNDSVEILILTKDVFSLKPELNYFSPQKYTVGLVEANFLGQANTFGINIHKDPESLNKVRTALRYTFNSPFGNYINFSGAYSSFGRSLTSGRRSENSFVVSAERPYLTNLFRWQGGVVLGVFANYDYFNDTLFSQKNKYKYTLLDSWIGLNNYKLNLFNLLKKEWSILYTARVTSKYFSQKPKFVDQDYVFNVVDNTSFLLQASLFRRSFYRFTHLFDLGRPEDIETGRLISLTGAYAGRNLNPGFYTSSEFQLTEHLGEDNFINLKYSIGGFYNNNAFYDGTAILYALFIPRKKDLGEYYWRNYFSLAYSHLFKQRYTPLIQGEGQWGLMDYGNTITTGNKRLAFRFESLLFIKEEVWGFNVAPLFTSQWLYMHRDKDESDEIYSALGLGARLRNRRWIASAVEAKMFFYPRLVGEAGTIGFSLRSTFDLTSTLSLLHRPEFIVL